ncbi:MAG: glycosyltransferase [Chloroflexota bacterium]
MHVLYHLPLLPPKHPTAEALSQEISSLSLQFNGRINYFNPNDRSPVYIPRFLFGFHQLRYLRRLESAFDIHHVYNPDPFPYPIFRFLKKPVVYTLSSRVENGNFNTSYFANLAAVTVYDEQSQAKLRRFGIQQAHFIQPGIEKGRFTPHPPPAADAPFLIASAPWASRHFFEKGIDVLLDTAVALPDLHLIFLWRGELYDEMIERVDRRHLNGRVKIINEVIDVDAQLKEVIATINLATHSGVVKAYPHSLMDSISAARPVIISDTLAMSQDVAQHNLGVVVNEITVKSLTNAIQTVRQDITAFYQNARAKGKTLYDIEQTIVAYQQVYDEMME